MSFDPSINVNTFRVAVAQLRTVRLARCESLS